MNVDRSPSDEAAPEPISPELVLVDPELARLARERLPEPGLARRDVPRATPLARSTAVSERSLPAPPVETEAPPRRRPTLWGALALACLAAIATAVALGSLRDRPGPVLSGSDETPAAGSRSDVRRAPAEVSQRPAEVSQRPPDRGAVAARPAHRGTAVAPGPARRRPEPERPASTVDRSVPRQDGGTPPPSGRTVVRGSAVGTIVFREPKTLRRATEEFGAPTSRRRTQDYCHVSWGALGLTIVLNRVGRGDPCSQDEVVGAVVKGRRWQTSRGLRVGDSFGRLKSLYPNAVARPDGWWALVVERRSVVGRVRPQPTLLAHVRDGRVDTLVVG